jgi:tetratricopeptide (TPR) repeat protein
VRAALKLAQALAAVERHDEAFSVARRAIELSNDEGTTRAEYAQLLNRAGKPTEAEAEFRRAIEATPPSGYAHDKFGHFLQDRGRNPEAIPLFREAAKLESASCRYHSCLATALDIAKDNAGAAVVYGQLAANRPTDSRWRLFQASHLTRAGDPKQALELVQAVLQKEAGNPTAWVQLGNARYALKDLGGAADAYLRAVELAPSDRRLHAHVAPRLLAADRPADLVAVMTKNLKQSADWLNQDDDHLLYNGACAAVLAARSAADPKEQTAFRLLGRVWTRAYLAWWKKKLAGTAADRESLAASLTNWLSDPDFNSVRPGIQRIAIPPAERAEWDALWADGRATLTAARTPPPRKE